MWGKVNKHQSKADGGEFSSSRMEGMWGNLYRRYLTFTQTFSLHRLAKWADHCFSMGRPICPSDRIMYEHLSKPIAQFASELDCGLRDVTHSSPGLPATLNPYSSPCTEWVCSYIISLSPPHRLLDVEYDQKEGKDKLATSKVSKQRQRIQIDHSEYTSIHWQMAVLSLNY